MPNRILSKDELVQANVLLDRIRAELNVLAGNDPNLLFAYRRKVSKMLTYDERSSPMERRKLKLAKRKAQDGLCAICGNDLPPNYVVLDRLRAADGYKPENTRLLCESCDRSVQAERRYA